MTPRHLVPAAWLAASLLGFPSLVSAQVPVTKSPTTPPAKVVPAHPRQDAGKPAAAKPPAVKVPMKTEGRAAKDSASLQLAVTGLTKEKVAPVTAALAGLSETFYQCPVCRHEQDAAGHCAKCDKDLVAEHAMVLHGITLDATGGTLGFAVQPHRSLRLSELEKALGTQGVSLSRDKLTTHEAGSLVVQGITAETATQVETALRESKLFESVSGRFDPTAKELVLAVRNVPAAPSLARVDAVLAKADPAAKLADVVWNGPTATG